jgi:hypothetical protein
MGFAVTSLVGTLLHFMYEWLGGALWVAPFSGVNESTWEHMKLLFWPMLIFAVVQSFFFRDRADFWCITLRGVLLGLVLIPVIFYTYNGAFGESPDWLNIAIFFICAAIAYIYEYRMLRRERSCCRSKKTSLALLFIIALMFILFTFSPPALEIFRDPTSDTFGI